MGLSRVLKRNVRLFLAQRFWKSGAVNESFVGKHANDGFGDSALVGKWSGKRGMSSWEAFPPRAAMSCHFQTLHILRMPYCV